MTVLEVPGASERVGRGTVLYAPHCARSAYIDALGVGLGRRSGGTGEEDGGEEEKDGEVLRGAPVLVVGNDVRDLIDGYVYLFVYISHYVFPIRDWLRVLVVEGKGGIKDGTTIVGKRDDVVL